MSNAPLRGRTLAAFVVIVLIWGSTWEVIRDQVGRVPPGWSITWRFVAAAAGMFVLALARRDRLRISTEGARLAVVLGFFQFFANFQLVYRAEQYLTSGLVAVLYALLMVPNTLLARALFGVRISARFVAGSAVAIAGIALLLLHEYWMARPGGEAALGIMLAVLGLLTASAANVAQAGPAARDQAPVPLIAWAMTAGAAMDAAFAWAVSGPPVFDFSPAYWMGTAYLAIAGSVVAFPLYYRLIQNMGAGRAAYNSVLVPVVAMTLSTLFEHYRWSLLALAGTVLALAGLCLALSGREDRG